MARSLAEIFADSPAPTPRRSLEDIFGRSPADDWEDLSPVLQRNRRTGETRPKPIPGGLAAYNEPEPEPGSLLFPSKAELAARRAGGKRALAAAGEAVASIADLPALAASGLAAAYMPTGVEAPSFETIRNDSQPGVIGRARRAVSAFDQRAAEAQLEAEAKAGASPLEAALAETTAFGVGNAATMAVPADLGAAKVARLARGARAVEGGVEGARAAARVAEEAAQAAVPAVERTAAPLAEAEQTLADRFAGFLRDKGLTEDDYYALPAARQHLLDAEFEVRGAPGVSRETLPTGAPDAPVVSRNLVQAPKAPAAAPQILQEPPGAPELAASSPGGEIGAPAGAGEVVTGQPVRLRGYHGTTADFDQFRPGEGTLGSFFSDRRDVADTFGLSREKVIGGKARTIEADLSFENPLVIDGGGRPAADFQFGRSAERLRQALENGGHDGLILRNVDDGAPSAGVEIEGLTDLYVARDPKRITIIRPEAAIPPEPPPHTSLKNAVAEPERAGRGLPPVEVEAGPPMDEAWAAARARVDADPELPRRVAADRVAGRPVKLSLDEENDVLLYDRMRLTNEHRQVLAGIEEGQAAGRDTLDLEQRLADVEKARGVNDEAARRAGTEWGRGGRFRQRLVAEDYSPLAQISRAKVAAGGELPAASRQRITTWTKELEQARADVEVANAKIAELEDAQTIKRLARDAAHQTRRAGRQATRQELDGEFQGLLAQFDQRAAEIRQPGLRAEVIPVRGLDPKLVKLMGQMAANRVQVVGVNLEEVVDHVYQAVRPFVEGLEPRDVRDAISGYGRETKTAPRSELQQQLAEIQRQGKLVSALEDVEAGKLPAKRSPLRGKPSPHVEELRQRVAQVIREQERAAAERLDGLVGGRPEEIAAAQQELADLQAGRLPAARARLARQEQELTQRLASVKAGTIPSPKARRSPLRLQGPDAEALARVNRLKEQLDGEVRKLELARQHWTLKLARGVAKGGRVVKLSGVATGIKLAGAVNARLLSSAAEEAIGGVTSHLPVFSRVALKAPRRGGFNARALGASYADVFSRETLRDMSRALKTGKTEFEAAFGAVHPAQDSEFLSVIGHSHKMLKVPAFRHEVRLSLEKRAAHAVRNGLNPEEPVLLAKIRGEALADGYKAILQGDNLLVDEFKAHLDRMRSRQGTAAPYVAAVEEVVFPIVRVPSNYVAEATSYAAGAGKSAWLLRKGVEALTPAEADMVLANLNKNILGLAVMYTGYRGYKQIGGYYRRGEKRYPDEGDVAFGDVRVGETDVPHQALHGAWLEMLQVGGTIHQVEDEYRLKGKENGTAAGVVAAAGGLAEQVPFVDEMFGVTRARDGGLSGLKAYLADLTRGVFIDPNTERVARILDQEDEPTGLDWFLEMMGLKHIEARKRYPRGYAEGVKMGVPKLREDVPEYRTTQ